MIVELPVTVKVLLFKASVPVPAVNVSPFIVVKVGVDETAKAKVPPKPKVIVPPPVKLVPAVTVN